MFINDIKIMGSKNIRIIIKVKIELIVIFEIIDIASISFYLGLKIKTDYQKKTIKLL